MLFRARVVERVSHRAVQVHVIGIDQLNQLDGATAAKVLEVRRLERLDEHGGIAMLPSRLRERGEQSVFERKADR